MFARLSKISSIKATDCIGAIDNLFVANKGVIVSVQAKW